MRRVAIAPRPDWRRSAEEHGFGFHTIDGAPYWDESVYYAFTLEQIERDIEAPTEELHAMAMALCGEIVDDDALLARLAIPPDYRSWLRRSWHDGEPQLYGRMDFAYDGGGPAKLYELNYDTPTALYEAAFFQWLWLEAQMQRGALPAGSDQFNSIQEALVESLGWIAPDLPKPLYFAAMRASQEDQGTIAYLRDCAEQAGIATDSLPIEDIGLSTRGELTDLDDRVIRALFKLYPLEDMFADEFGAALPRAGVRLIEPPWKAVLSNKGFLPLLWERHRGHPNLLEARFVDDAAAPPPPGWVRKPYFSREGANVAMTLADGRTLRSEGPPDEGPWIQQRCHPLPDFDGRHPLLGSWVIADRACGLGIREDDSLITRDTSRFVPHAIEPTTLAAPSRDAVSAATDAFSRGGSFRA